MSAEDGTWTRQDALASAEEDLELEIKSLELAKESADVIRQLYDAVGVDIQNEDESIAYWQGLLDKDVNDLIQWKKELKGLGPEKKRIKKSMVDDKDDAELMQAHKECLISTIEFEKSLKEAIKSCGPAIRADKDSLRRHKKLRARLVKTQDHVAADMKRDDETVVIHEKRIKKFEDRIERIKRQIEEDKLREQRQ